MVFKIRTSKKTMECFEEIGATENLAPFVLSKLAISMSLKSNLPLTESDFKTDNAGLELNRQTITAEYDSLYKSLINMDEGRHISDDEYFSHMVLDDLNLIIRDIREAHKKDSESAPQTTVADELKENLEAVQNFKGSRDEKLVILYCKQLGINYKNLSDEEFRWLIRILKKSKKMGTPISQRKKR